MTVYLLEMLYKRFIVYCIAIYFENNTNSLSTIRRLLQHFYFPFYPHTVPVRRYLQLACYTNYLLTYLFTLC